MPVGGPGARPGGSLAHARTQAGLTITELARQLHVSRPLVSLWETSARAAPRRYWPALGRALGISPDQVAELFAGRAPGRDDGRRLPALAYARRRAGLTQRHLADRLGVAASTVSMWESAGVPVSAHLLDHVARLLATDLAQLALPPPSALPGPDPRPLRLARQRAGMTRREAAAHLGIAVGTLARYEAGERAIPVAVVRRMARTYRRDAAELLRCSGTTMLPLPPAPWWPADLPAVLAALRFAAGLTPGQVGRAVGRSGQAVRAWERGDARPLPATRRRLEVLFGLSAGALARSHRTPGRSAGETPRSGGGRMPHMVEPDRDAPQPRDIALEQETPAQAAALEAASAPESDPEDQDGQQRPDRT